MEHLINFFGRFHPLLVHLPIGAIIVAFLFDALSLSKSYRKLNVAVQPALLFGAVSALLSVVTGLSLAEEGGYQNETLSFHKYSGIATTVFAFALLFLRRHRSILSYERKTRKPIRFFLFIPVVISLIVAGHFGGSLTHGDAFITEFSFFPPAEKIDPITKIQFIDEPGEAVLYQDVIQPILESKCYSCHSATKQKGDLRLDNPTFVVQGGKEGKVISAGAADSSALFARMMLPPDHDDHMPPNEKPQPSSVELDLIRLWINEGARFDKKIKELHASQKAIGFVSLLSEGIKKNSWLPKKDIDVALDSDIKKLKNTGALVLPVGENSNYLQVSFINTRSITDESLSLLNAVDEQVVSLRFSYCVFQSTDLKFLERFPNLTWLYLDHTNTNDTSFQTLTLLPSLKYLNVVFTDVTENALALNKLPALEQLFIFETNVNANAVKNLQREKPALKIDTGGIILPRIVSDTIIYRKKS